MSSSTRTTTSIRFERVDEGHYRAYQGERLVALLYRNPNYKRFPWEIEYAAGGKFVSRSGHDCFDFPTAKQMVRDEMIVT